MLRSRASKLLLSGLLAFLLAIPTVASAGKPGDEAGLAERWTARARQVISEILDDLEFFAWNKPPSSVDSLPQGTTSPDTTDTNGSGGGSGTNAWPSVDPDG